MSRFVRLFPLWVTVGGALALAYPPAFTWFLPYIKPGLAVIMLGMGVTLTTDDFRRVARAPRPVWIGVALQYTVMPLLGFAIGRLFGLPTPFAVGLVLVCCCPGGTASNVIAYLAHADVALSVSMTAVSTLLAALLTPALSTLLIGDAVPVDAWGLFESTATVVLFPVTLGLALRTWLPKATERLLPVAPVLAVVAIVLIVGAILGMQRGAIIEAGPALVGAVVLAHALGFGLAYLAAYFLSPAAIEDRAGAARTISIEVGMQNSGLGAALAREHFADPLTAIPSAISAMTHCILGSALAAVWSRRPTAAIRDQPTPDVF